MTARPKVLCVMSKGRSGSTLLDTVLGQMPGFHSTGELGHLWEWGLIGGGSCGCARPISKCPHWQRVLNSAFPDGTPDPRVVLAMKRKVSRWRALPWLMRQRGDRSWPALRSYGHVLAKLYTALAEVSDSEVIVDSTKLPTPTPFGLVPGVDVFVVHLVRDPRAVAHSWSRRRNWEPGTGSPEMPRWGAAHSTLSWLAHNTTAEIIRRRTGSGRYLLVRYEDFVREPATVLRSVQRLVLGEAKSSLPVDDARTVEVDVTHTAFGNPSRFRSGLVELREDRAWVWEQTRRDRLVVTATGFPLMRRYGYAVTDPGRTLPDERGRYRRRPW